MPAETRPTPAAAGPAPIFIESIDIRNFRGLTVKLDLDPELTVLVGRNNSGKTRILRALALALGGVVAELDDLTVRSPDPATIDLVVAPMPEEGAADELFVADVGQALAPSLVALSPDRERFAWRTVVHPSAEGVGARTESVRLSFIASDGMWEESETSGSLTRRELRLFRASLIGSSRDLSDELARPGSAIRRVLSDLELSADKQADIEASLADLSGELVDHSQSLRAVVQSLDRAEQHLGGFGRPALNPLPARIEELARSIDIDLDAGTGAMPVRLHGSGPRSLASLLVQSVYYERRLGRDGSDRRPHPVTLIEEPEAHLHPQMQVELPAFLGDLSGQVVVSTHSPQLVTAVHHGTIRLVRSHGGATDVVDLAPVARREDLDHRARHRDFHAEEIERLKRLIERPFGELLFASAVVIGDGGTERGFLPPLLRHALEGKAHGVVVVDPDGMGKHGDVVAKFAGFLRIPWYLFADQDDAGRSAVTTICAARGDTDDLQQASVIWVVDDGTEGALEQLMIGFDEDLCRAAAASIRPDLETDDTLGWLQKVKPSGGLALARELIDRYPDSNDWPESIRTLISTLDRALTPRESDGDHDRHRAEFRSAKRRRE